MRNIKNKFAYVLFFFIPLILWLTGCNKDEKQGKQSLEGVWSVHEIESIYANFLVENGVVTRIDGEERSTDSGDLGVFTFSKHYVTYSYTRNDTLYTGKGSWELKNTKVKTGFTKANNWKLTIANDVVFDLRFEDETKNAEKKATHISLDGWPKFSGSGIAFFMSLKKK